MADCNICTGAALPDKCPACGGALKMIEYGSANPAMFERFEKGETFRGGCVVNEFSPSHRCVICHRSFGREFVRRGS